MSKNCGNPDCQVHGNDPETKARIQAVTEIKVNEELMSLIRTLAANAHNHMALLRGGFVDFEAKTYMNAILCGNQDEDPAVQGIIMGFAVAMAAGHEPTKYLVTKCSDIKEAPYLTERVEQASREAHPERYRRGTKNEEGWQEISLEDLFAMLGLRR